MPDFCNKTLAAIAALLDEASENVLLGSVRVRSAESHEPKGIEQDCDCGVVATEWVKQFGPGFAGDDFHGFITWKLGDFYVVAEYST